MSISVQHLQQCHIDEILPRLQNIHAPLGAEIRNNPHYLGMVMDAGPCIAFCDGDKTLAISGYIDFDAQRSLLWAAFSFDCRGKFVALFRAMLLAMKVNPRPRIEAYIDPTFPPARRFAKAGGFMFEGLMKRHAVDGTDRELWALVQ